MTRLSKLKIFKRAYRGKNLWINLNASSRSSFDSTKQNLYVADIINQSFNGFRFSFNEFPDFLILITNKKIEASVTSNHGNHILCISSATERVDTLT